MIHWKEALNIDITYERILYAKYLLKYHVLKLLCIFAQRNIQPEGI